MSSNVIVGRRCPRRRTPRGSTRSAPPPEPPACGSDEAGPRGGSPRRAAVPSSSSASAPIAPNSSWVSRIASRRRSRERRWNGTPNAIEAPKRSCAAAVSNIELLFSRARRAAHPIRVIPLDARRDGVIPRSCGRALGDRLGRPWARPARKTPARTRTLLGPAPSRVAPADRTLRGMAAIHATAEHERLEQARAGDVPWKAWGPVPERAPVGDGARGLQRGRRRVELLPARPGALARLPLGRGRDRRDLRRAPAAVPRARALERRGPDPQGADVRPAPTARATTARTPRSTGSTSTARPRTRT